MEREPQIQGDIKTHGWMNVSFTRNCMMDGRIYGEVVLVCFLHKIAQVSPKTTSAAPVVNTLFKDIRKVSLHIGLSQVLTTHPQTIKKEKGEGKKP